MTGERAQLLEVAAKGLGVELDAESLRRLGIFLGLVGVWNERIRLVGDRDPEIIVAKHVVDSLAVVPLMPAHGLVTDVGSGGGFPGIVIGCLRPDLKLVLIESRRRPVSFLREVLRSVPLPEAQVLEQRGEDAVRESRLAGHAQAVVSRALRADVFLPIASQLVATDGTVIAMQTPASMKATAEVGMKCGLELTGQRRYELAAGGARLLMVFRPAMTR